METTKVTQVSKLFILFVTSTSSLQLDFITKGDSNYDYCDDHQLIQKTANNFINDVISLQFPDCYGIQIRNEILGKGNIIEVQTRQMPVISLNLAQQRYHLVIKEINSNAGKFQIRFRKQCLVYEVFVESLNDTNEMTEIFLTTESQKRAKNSFIFVNQYMNYEAARTFLMHPKLKNYKYRVWTDLVPLDFYNPDYSLPGEYGFIFYYFCYYCNGGEQGISSKNIVFGNAQDIREVEDIFPDVTKNFEGHAMRVTAPPAPPLVLITPSKTNPKKNIIHGQQKNILESIASKYNFTCNLYSAPGGTTGSKLGNGSWNGVMGEILNGRADIGLSVAIAYDRNEIADFTVSVFYAFLVLVSTKPIPFFEWEAIFYPFKATAWLALIAATILTLYLFQFLHNHALKLEVPSRKNWKSKFEILKQIKTEIVTDFRAVYMVIGSLLEQGVPIDYNTMPSRMIATFWMFFAIIITCAYRSKLFAFLISPTILTPPNSFEDLSISDYTWGMKSLGGIALLFITNSPLQYIRNIGEQMEIYTDKYTCLDKTFHGKFTCIIYRAYIDYMMEVRYWKVRHQFHISDFVTPPVGSAWALAKYSPLQPDFDKISFRIYEMGLADKYLVDYQVSFAKIARALAQASNSTDDTFDLNTNFKNDDDSGPKPLEMENVYGGFFILLFGIVVGGAILMTERIKHNKLVLKQRKIWIMMRIRMKAFRKRNGKNKKVSFHQLVNVILPSVNASKM